MKASTIKMLRYGLRAAQILFGVIAFGTAITGDTNMCPFGKNLFDSNLQINFLIANGVLVAICVAAWSFVFEIKQLLPTPPPLATGLFDAVWAIFALAGGIAAASSNFVSNICTQEALRLGVETSCDLNCSSVQASVVFTFLIFFVSIASMVLSLFVASKLTEFKV